VVDRLWNVLTLAGFVAALVLTIGSTYLWLAQGVPFARPPHPWNQATVHFAGPWLIWAVSGWLARRF
jgi:hypothetical protein